MITDQNKGGRKQLKDMYSTCDAWIIVKHFYFHVKIPQSKCATTTLIQY